MELSVLSLKLWSHRDVKRLHAVAIMGRRNYNLSNIPSHVHIRPGYRDKLADLQGTLKLQVQFYNRISRSQRLRSENWHGHYSLHTHGMATNASMSQGCVLGYSSINTPVGTIHLVGTCKSLLPHYQVMLVFFNNIRCTYVFIHI